MLVELSFMCGQFLASKTREEVKVQINLCWLKESEN